MNPAAPRAITLYLVGWIEDPNHGTVWIMKNSWGINWGDSGYMYVKAGTSNIGNNATYVVYQPLPDPLAPSVSYLDTVNHTADNRLDMNEAVTVDVRNLIVNFDERMRYNNGVNDVATLSTTPSPTSAPTGARRR